MQASFRSYIQRLPVSHKAIRKSQIYEPLSFTRRLSTSTVTTADSIRNAVANGQLNHGYQLFTKSYDEGHHKPVNSLLESANGRPKSRYLAHVLVHALHRSHNPLNAASVTKLCMERGIKIRGHTFDTVFAGIAPPCDVTLPVRRSNATNKLPRIPLLTATLGLLKAARKSGHKQHSWMYDRVINAFLLQGEVLTATLLFITLVKEWNAHRLAKMMDEAQVPEQASEAEVPPPSSRTHSQHLTARPYILAPKGIWMEKITAIIEDDMAMKTGQSIAALRCLVNLIEEDYQYLPGRWRLLQIIRSALRAQYLDDETCQRFHRAMRNLCNRPVPIPGVDLFSYHILLQYSLRDQRSIDMGANVLCALCKAHEPSGVTYNILLDGLASLKDSVSVKAIIGLLETRSPYTTGPVPLAPKSFPTGSDTQHRIIEFLSSRSVPLPDEYTIVTIMSEAIGRGDPQTASRLLHQLLPELSESDSRPKELPPRRTSLRRAADLSPHFWATAQHAARKTKSMRMSMRIWKLVMRAEKSRYHCNSKVDTAPCIYTVEAYTSQFRLFLSKLVNIQNMIKASVDDKEPICSQKAILSQYGQILDFIQPVLVTLRDRITGKARLTGFEFDGGLAKVLFAIVEALFGIWDRIPLLSDGPMDGSVEKVGLADGGPRLSKILGTIRRIMHDCQVPHPERLLKLGFATYNFKPVSPLVLRRPVSAPPLDLSSWRRKRPAFRVRYSSNHFRPLIPPKAVPHRGRTEPGAAKVGKAVLTRLGHVERVAAMPPG